MSRYPAKEPGKGRDLWRPLALLVVLILIFVLARVLGLGNRVGELRHWIDSLGPWGPVVFVILYIAGVVLALPGSALTVAAGALFGSFWGILVVSLAATLGASLAFLIARYFAREAVARWLSHNDKFRRLDEMAEKHGTIIVALTRLVPIFPFNLLNYGFGLTKVPFRTYVFWSWLCMLPGTILYVVGADAFTKGLSHGKIPWGLVGVLAVVVIVLTFLARHARRALSHRGVQ
jgi:uncharacterized membrane protein YdjX (TVP38/TMEM64 family)